MVSTFKYAIKSGKRQKLYGLKKKVFYKVKQNEKINPKFFFKKAEINSIPFIIIKKSKGSSKETVALRIPDKYKLKNIVSKWFFKSTFLKRKPFTSAFFSVLKDSSENKGAIVNQKINYQSYFNKIKN